MVYKIDTTPEIEAIREDSHTIILAGLDPQKEVERLLTLWTVQLDIQEETLQFLLGSRAIKNPAELIRMLFDIGEMLWIERFILYQIINTPSEQLARILLLYSREGEEEYVGQMLPITRNPNLEEAVKTEEISRIPVPGIGIDMAVPIRRDLIVGVDDDDTDRYFSEEDMKILRPTILSLGMAYVAGEALRAKGTDGLTGLSNRLALDYAIDKGVDIFDNSIAPIQAIAFFDIDHFKKFNSKFGHHVGDVVLKHVAGIIDREARKLWGRAFRYGWEEMVVTFDRLVSQKEIDSIRQAVENSSCSYKRKEHIVRTSVGFCSAENLNSEDCFDIQWSITRTANAAMLKAKNTGRNRTVQYELWQQNEAPTREKFVLFLKKFLSFGKKEEATMED